jgi:hypothetical protein
VLHLHKNRARNQNAAIDFSKNFRTAQTDEIVERAGIGNNDHACDYLDFLASTRSNVAISLSRSPTV